MKCAQCVPGNSVRKSPGRASLQGKESVYTVGFATVQSFGLSIISMNDLKPLRDSTALGINTLDCGYC